MSNRIGFLRHVPHAAVVVIGVALAAAGAPMAWAVPPVAPGAVNAAAAEPNAADGALASPSSASPRQTWIHRNMLRVTVVGVIVVEGGPSAVELRSIYGSKAVREGEEIDDGIRLLQVQADQIVIEREGIGQEIVPFSGGGVAHNEVAGDAIAVLDAATAALDPAAAAVIRERAERAERLGSRMRGNSQ